MPKTAITGSLIVLDIDRAADQPIYRQILDQLRDAILSGRLVSGTKLPSTRILAKEFGISRNTALQVFEVLKDEGLLVSHVGAGTFVRSLSDQDNIAKTKPGIGPASRDGPLSAFPFRTLSRQGRSLIASATGEFTERPTPFMPDLPDLREFPIRTWLRLLNETSGRLTGRILAETSNAGYEPLRRAIAQHLNASRGMSCDYRQVIVTTGSQQTLDLVCRMLLDAGDPVWMEEPGYVGARSVIRANGGVIWPVPVDAHGMQVPFAETVHPVPRLIYVSPSRQYPLGATLSPARREALISIASRNGGWIVEDDYDHEFIYAGTPPRAIFAMDGSARTIHMGTFSKTLLPSFRLGYIVVPADLATHFATARAIVDRHASLIEQIVLSEFIQRGLFVSHIRRMRSLNRERRARLVAGLEEIFAADCCLSAGDGGTHLILPLRRGSGDRKLAAELAEKGIVLRPMSPYYATNNLQEGLLIGFSAFNEEEARAGLHRLAGFRKMLAPMIRRDS